MTISTWNFIDDKDETKMYLKDKNFTNIKSSILIIKMIYQKKLLLRTAVHASTT